MSKHFVCGDFFVSSFIHVRFGVHKHSNKYEPTFELFRGICIHRPQVTMGPICLILMFKID